MDQGQSGQPEPNMPQAGQGERKWKPGPGPDSDYDDGGSGATPGLGAGWSWTSGCLGRDTSLEESVPRRAMYMMYLADPSCRHGLWTAVGPLALSYIGQADGDSNSAMEVGRGEGDWMDKRGYSRVRQR